MLLTKIAELENDQSRQSFATEESFEGEGSVDDNEQVLVIDKFASKRYRSRYLCFGCEGSVKRVYFELIDGQRRCKQCMNDHRITVKNLLNQDTSL